VTPSGSRKSWPWALLGVATVVYCGWALAPASALYAKLLTPHVLVAVAAVLKLVYLLAGALWAFSCRDRLEPGNPARPAWALLSLGLVSTFAGQLSLAPFQVVKNESPFPSVGDLYYVLAYPFLIAALVVFLRAYREAGLPMGSPGERRVILAGVVLLGVAVGAPILHPVLASEGTVLERLLNVAYPVLDLVLLAPLALLLRVALRLQGSHVGSVWGLLLGGMVFLCVGDIFFAYFSALGQQHLDPFVHATYILAYGLIAGGTHRQLVLLRS
jgi:hypothetical protein